MNILIILGPPKPGRFNHAIAHMAAETLQGLGHVVTLRDLYAEGFAPILPAYEILRDAAPQPDVQEHCGQLAVADGSIMANPNLWAQPPAMPKGRE